MEGGENLLPKEKGGKKAVYASVKGILLPTPRIPTDVNHPERCMSYGLDGDSKVNGNNPQGHKAT